MALSAYNNATQRQNLFNQTDLTWVGSTGRVRHTVLVGAELGRQWTDNFRNTGYFNNTATSILVPFGAPTISTPITFRQSVTDADNHLRHERRGRIRPGPGGALASRAAGRRSAVRSVRPDVPQQPQRRRRCGRTDNLVSPRAGIVYKPIVPLSIYGSYTVSYLPSSGDQFSSLTVITEQLKPEAFDNYEVGAKWDVRPDFSLTTAVYRLDRTNTRSIDPNDPTRIVQTGSQRTNGYELGLNGRLTAGVEHRRRLRVSGCVRDERDGDGEAGRDRGAGAAPHRLALEQLPVPAARGRGPRPDLPLGHVRGD